MSNAGITFSGSPETADKHHYRTVPAGYVGACDTGAYAQVKALKLKATQLYEVVERLDRQLAGEEAAREADPTGFERADRDPFIPGMIISLVHVPLNSARRMLNEHRGDEFAVSLLRVAENLVCQLVTWRGTVGDGGFENLFAHVESKEAVEKPSKGVYTPPRFIILESVEEAV